MDANSYVIGHEDLAELEKPIETATGLPGRAYGQEFFDWECSSLFSSTWIAITLGARVPNTGDVLPLDIAGRSLVVVRGQDEKVRVFYNVCRHRGIRLVAEPCSKQKMLICPWHAWTYSLEGKLQRTARLAGESTHVHEAFDTDNLGLVEVPSAQFLDFIFVNMSDDPVPFDQHIKPLRDLIGHIDLSSLRHSGGWDSSYPGNWKLSFEGGIEDYHLRVAHPQVTSGITSYEVRIDAADGVYVCTSAVIERASQDPAREALPKFDFAPGTETNRTFIIGLFPFGNIAVKDNHALLGMMLPDGPSRTKLVFDLYFPEATMARTEFDDLRKQMLQDWIEIVAQDTHLVEAAQANLYTRDVAGIKTRFSPYWEGAVLAFEQMIVRRAAKAEPRRTVVLTNADRRSLSVGDRVSV